MGWTYSHKSTSEKPLDYLRRELFTADWMTKNNRSLVGEAMAGRVAYFAMRFPVAEGDIYQPDADGMATTCIVILTAGARDHYNFGYKDMDESMGPCEATCPERILALLSPIKPALIEKGRAAVGAGGYSGALCAYEWRERCRAGRAAKRGAIKLADRV